MKQNRNVHQMKVSKWKREKEYLIPYLENKARTLATLRDSFGDKAFGIKNQTKYNKRQLKKFEKQFWDTYFLTHKIENELAKVKYGYTWL